MTQRSVIIKTTELTKKYGDHTVLDALNLTIHEGEVFGFLGHNGAGKTTTVNILTTLLEPTSGSAKICGHDVTRDGLRARRSFGYLPESVRFYDTMTAYENVEYLAKLSGMKHPKKRIEEVFEYLEFTSHLHQKVGEFSKGMRQRVGIAQAIVHNPNVLFLDEPTSGLDPEGIIQLRNIILRLSKEQNITIFMNTHLLSEVAKTCTSIGVLNQGKLIYNDTLANTLERFPTEQSLESIYTSVDTPSKERTT
ncbi:MAG: transporter, ATP-binding protein [Candidatus Saccharibacteria bacterium]|nr:transporter, ATP-binding protein [Candidatus Saccharibacteria bacterium]